MEMFGSAERDEKRESVIICVGQGRYRCCYRRTPDGPEHFHQSSAPISILAGTIVSAVSLAAHASDDSCRRARFLLPRAYGADD